jgi:acyl-CoA thioesterase-2
MPVVDLDGVLGCLEVERVEGDRWRAPNLEMDYRRIFGGQLLAQAIALATASAEAKTVKSVSCLFPREGQLDEPFEFVVEETQTGRAFAARRVSAAHGEKVFFVAQVSLHTEEDGLDHQDDRPDVGSPEDATDIDLGMIPWPCRVVDGVDLADPAAGPAEYAFWTRVDRDVGVDPVVNQALLAYATDLTVIGTALRPHEGVSQADAHVRLHTAVTGHTLWFHRPFSIEDWCLVAQRVPVTAGARAFGQGHVWDRDGRLVASFAQESMIRPLPTDEDG